MSVVAGLVVAVQRAHDAKGSSWFPRFASLFGALVSHAMARYLLDDERAQVDRSLRVLAAEADQLIPPDYAFLDHMPDGAEHA